MNWLITGGCGFLGTSLIKRILREEKNSNITIVDNLLVGSRKDLENVCDFQEITQDNLSSSSNIKLLVADIVDEKVANFSTKDIDIIVHLAANTGVQPSIDNPREDLKVNIIGTFNYLNAARLNGVSMFITASSGATVGNVEPPIHEEMITRPISPYGASKLATESYCSAFYNSYGLKSAILRFSNVYGPNSYKKNSVVAKFIKQALKDNHIVINGDGKQTRDFIYIDDLIEAIFNCSKSNLIKCDIFQIASGVETSINKLSEIIIKHLNLSSYGNIDVRYREIQPGDVLRNYAVIDKASKILKWKPKEDLVSGIEKTINYYLSSKL